MLHARTDRPLQATLYTARSVPLIESPMPTACLHERTTAEEIEAGDKLQPKFDEQGLIPCIVTDVHSNETLMFAYMNRQALELTIATGKATYFSRSRNKLWVKGESSGQTQLVRELRTDCDQDVVQLKVDMSGHGAACHTGYRSCFYRKWNADKKCLERDGGERLFDPAKVYRT